MTSVPPPPGPLDPGGAPPQPPQPESSQQHAQFAPPGAYPYAGPGGSQQGQPPAAPGQWGQQGQWGQPGPTAGGAGQYAPAAQPWGAPQQWQHSQPGQAGQYPQQGQYAQPGQPGQYAQPGAYAQPGQPGQPGQYAQPNPYSQPGQQPSWGAPQPAAPKSSKRRAVLLSVLGALVVVGLAVAAYFLLSPSDVEALPKDVDAVTTAHARALTVGNCLESAPGGSAVAEVTVVPCADDHEAQVVAGKKFSGDTFPGDAKVIDRTTAVCPGRSITSDSAPETLDFLVWTPSEGSWSEGDRQGLCIAVSPDAPLTGSLIR